MQMRMLASRRQDLLTPLQSTAHVSVRRKQVRLEHFHTWLEEAQIRPSEILHLKGFGGNVPSFFDKDARAFLVFRLGSPS